MTTSMPLDADTLWRQALLQRDAHDDYSRVLAAIIDSLRETPFGTCAGTSSGTGIIFALGAHLLTCEGTMTQDRDTSELTASTSVRLLHRTDRTVIDPAAANLLLELRRERRGARHHVDDRPDYALSPSAWQAHIFSNDVRDPALDALYVYSHLPRFDELSEPLHKALMFVLDTLAIAQRAEKQTIELSSTDEAMVLAMGLARIFTVSTVRTIKMPGD